MTKFLLGACSSFFILAGIWFIGLEAQYNVGTPSSRWVFDAYQKKIAIAEQSSKNRILIVAGSNALFGINSQKIELFWHRPTINLGVNAGLGLPYILYLAKKTAKPGDIILMPMEYALYLDSGEANSQIIDYAFARDPSYLQQLSTLDYLRFSFAMSPERWIQGLSRPIDLPVTAGTYGAHHLDDRGDQTHSSSNDRNESNKIAVKNAKEWSYGARALSEKGGWDSLLSFSLWANKNHVCLIAIPSVLLYKNKYATDPIEKNFYASLPRKIESLGIPYIGKPSDFMYPPEWFFDTDHHLQDWARNFHTEKIIHLLNSDPLSYCNK